MIKQLAHACIHTTDLEETARFYFDVLGCEKGFEFRKGGDLFGFYIQLGNNTFIEVFQGEPGGDGTIAHLALEVDDMDAVIEKIGSAGFEIGEKKIGRDNSWQVWSKDPSGVRLEFHQYTATSCQLLGGTCSMDP